MSGPLEALGWDGAWRETFTPFAAAGLEPGRVLAADREGLRVGTAAGEETALVPGRLLHQAAGPEELPCTGDWLALRRLAPGEPLLVEAVVPRRGVLLRRAAGRRTEAQALAANVDVALLVSALTGDFNARRLERWLALAREAGAAPVVVLTKEDLVGDSAPFVQEASAIAAPAPVLALDALGGGAGVAELEPWLSPGRTLVLLGSSGVGKSTLLNRLAGRALAATAALAADGRGRHTTTRRELVALPGGALLIDTPGLREVGVWLGEDALASLFPEIEALSARCRFRDCTHGDEPGCAVREAVQRGEVDGARLDSLRRLGAEQEALRRRTDEGAAREERRRWRAIHRASKKHRPRQL
jgi:ribosome biogenesis GTPase